MTKKYKYSELMKIPYDYEDFITDLWFQGCLLADLASDMVDMGHYSVAFTFEMLAKMNLHRLKVFERLIE